MRAGRPFRSVAAALLIGTAVGASPPSAQPLLSDPQAIFANARVARTGSAYAHYAVYATVVRFRREDDSRAKRSWDTVEDLHRRLVHAQALSRQDAANPHVPHGFNIGIDVGPGGPVMGIPPKGRIVTPEHDGDPIGAVTFAVDQDFGLALNAPSIAATPDMSVVASSAVSLPHIGRTGTIARTYAVTDLGDVVENGGVRHHLGLRPLRDPRRYRLRELWIDGSTSLPTRAIVAGIGNRAPLDSVDWRVDFIQVQGGTYISRETALAPLDTDEGRLDDVSVTFEELRPTNRLTAEESLGLSGEVGTTDP